MKKIILIIAMIAVATLLIGCNEKKIVLNENTIREQANNENGIIVKEKKFNLDIRDDTGFEPCYIGDDGIYGLTYVKGDNNFGMPNENNTRYKMKKVLESGVIEETGYKENIYDSNKLPYVIEENEKMELVYRNYLTGEEKILLDKSVSNKVDGFTSKFEYSLIQNSNYAIIEKSISNKDILKKTTYIINVNSGEKYVKNSEIKIDNITVDAYNGCNVKYFYTGEGNTIYSISNLDGTIKKLLLKNGEIEEFNYDRINDNLNSTYTGYIIYSNGIDTRIIYDVINSITNVVESQHSYKVTTKENEELFNLNKKIGSYMYVLKMLSNDIMLSKINEEYVLVKFDSDGIKLVYKFDFSDVGNWENQNIRDVRISSNKDVSKILLKIVVGNYKTNEITEVFKMYDIKS